MIKLSTNKLIFYKYSDYALLVVFILGIITIILTRIIFYSHHPEYFLDSIPTISKSAAYAPGSYYFRVGMSIVSFCSLITWCLIYKINRLRINKLLNSGDRKSVTIFFNYISCLLGIIAAIFLALFSNITLEDHTNYHINFSKYFFFTEIFAFIIDSVCCSIIYYQNSALNGIFNKKYFYFRYTLTILVILSSLVYLFLFENRHIFSNEYQAQLVYVIAEHVTAILCFSYAVLYFPEVNKYLKSVR